MQTFLPYQDYEKTAQALDRQRLGKQRVECLQIIRCLMGYTAGWKSHPAVKMWVEPSTGQVNCHLFNYGLTICDEWVARGYRDTCKEKMLELFREFESRMNDSYPTVEPWWVGDPRLHASHRSNLLRKDPEHYGQFGWEESPDLEYWWPTKEG